MVYKNYSVLGHLDLVKRYGNYGKVLDDKPFDDIIEAILKQAIYDGKGIEVNTSCYRYNLPDLTPSRHILNMYKDIIKISNEGIVIYDLIYNLMQNKNELYAIDTDDYFFSDKDDILKRNVNTFNESIMIFLVDNYFDEFVQSNKKLLEMYKGKDINLVDFITLFYKLLSENIGKDIITLNDAKSLVNKKYYEPNFIRSIKR